MNALPGHNGNMTSGVLPDGNPYLTTSQVAARLDVSRTWVKAIASELGAIKIPRGERWRFAYPTAAIDAYVSRQAARSINTTALVLLGARLGVMA